MNRMAKLFFLVVPALAAGILIILYFSFNILVKQAVESFGSRLTGTEVHLQRSHISLFSGRGQLKGLTISNPRGFSRQAAFRLGEIRIALALSSVFSSRIFIEEIFINEPEILYEKGGRGSNITAILTHARSLTQTKKPVPASPSPAAGPGSEKYVRIQDFIIKNGKIHMSVAGLDKKLVSIALPDMHVKDIGKEEKKMTAVRVFEVLLGELNRKILWAVTGSSLPFAEEGKKVIEKLKGIFTR